MEQDSFDVRFCYDLAELILSHLPIQDKIKFEKVSKQFRHCLNVKQDILKLEFVKSTNNNELYHIKPLIRLIEKVSRNKFIFEINCNYLIKVLNKFQNIRVIEFCKPIDRSVIIKIRNINEVFQVINHNCNFIRSLIHRFNSPEINNIIYFGEKMGSQITNLRFSSENRKTLKQLVSMCPNLKSLSDINITDLIQNEAKNKSLVKISNLIIDDYKFLSYFKIFIENYKQNLTYLNLTLFCDSDVEEVEFIELLPQLTKLNYLRIQSNCEDTHSERLPGAFNLIAKNCNDLVNLEFKTVYRLTFDLKALIKSFDNCKNLKSFSFGFFEIYSEDDNKFDFDFDCLKNNKNLITLELGISKLFIQNFNNFAQNFTNLKSIKIKSENELDEKIIELFDEMKIKELSITKFRK